MITEYTKRFVIVVTKGQQIAANAKAKLVDTGQGIDDATWTVGLSPSGNPPATHLWCNWQMKPDEGDELQILLAEIPGHNEQVFELDYWDPSEARPTPDEILNTTTPKLKRIEPSI